MMKKCVGTVAALLLPAAVFAQTDDSDFSVSSPKSAPAQKSEKPAAPAKPSTRPAPADDSESDFVASTPGTSSPPTNVAPKAPAAPVADKAAADSDFESSQHSSPASAIATAATAPAQRTLPKGTTVTFTINMALGSKISTIDQQFPISLLQSVTLPDGVIIPAGITGIGEVVHAAKGGFGGKAGELILAARYLTCGSTKIPLGKFNFSGAGQNRAVEAFLVSAFVVAGGEINVPAGTVGTARTTADVTLPESAGNSCQS